MKRHAGGAHRGRVDQLPRPLGSDNGGPGDNVHVGAVTTEDAPVEVRIRHADHVVGGKDDPLECKIGVTGGVVVQRNILAGGCEVPNDLGVTRRPL